MSKFAPWTDKEAEKAREEAANLAFQMSSYLEDDFESGFKAGVTWAAVQIEKCPTIYASREGSRIWGLDRNKYDDTIEAKLVGVREVEK